MLLIALCLLLSACESVSWLWQAARGQWHLRQQAQALETVLENPETPLELRDRLILVTELGAFASRELQLADEPAFQSYVELDRSFVLWNVFAVPEFSLQPRQWCFPIAGCVSYRGYFDEAAAQRYGDRLAARGYDVWIGGVAAYSTLGWLDDPVLSTWLWRKEVALAALVFHELSHRRVYVAGDTRFSESLASVLEEELLRAWLEERGEAGRLAAYRRRTETRRLFAGLVQCTWIELDSLYQQRMTREDLQKGKDAVLEKLRVRYRQHSPDWPEPNEFDQWMSGRLNNARLLTVLSYQGWVPALQRVLAEEHGDLSRFLEEMDRLGAMPADARSALLEKLHPVDVATTDCPLAH